MTYPETGLHDICRVCRCEGTLEQPLYYPCKCSGSIKHVHEECLRNWIKHSSKIKCELCSHAYIFHPIYKPDTPDVLPWDVFLFGIVKKLFKGLAYMLKIACIGFFWAYLIPVFTSISLNILIDSDIEYPFQYFESWISDMFLDLDVSPDHNSIRFNTFNDYFQIILENFKQIENILDFVYPSDLLNLEKEATLLFIGNWTNGIVVLSIIVILLLMVILLLDSYKRWKELDMIRLENLFERPSTGEEELEIEMLCVNTNHQHQSVGNHSQILTSSPIPEQRNSLDALNIIASSKNLLETSAHPPPPSPSLSCVSFSTTNQLISESSMLIGSPTRFALTTEQVKQRAECMKELKLLKLQEEEVKKKILNLKFQTDSEFRSKMNEFKELRNKNKRLSSILTIKKTEDNYKKQIIKDALDKDPQLKTKMLTIKKAIVALMENMEPGIIERKRAERKLKQNLSIGSSRMSLENSIYDQVAVNAIYGACDVPPTLPTEPSNNDDLDFTDSTLDQKKGKRTSSTIVDVGDFFDETSISSLPGDHLANSMMINQKETIKFPAQKKDENVPIIHPTTDASRRLNNESLSMRDLAQHSQIDTVSKASNEGDPVPPPQDLIPVIELALNEAGRRPQDGRNRPRAGNEAANVDHLDVIDLLEFIGYQGSPLNIIKGPLVIAIAIFMILVVGIWFPIHISGYFFMIAEKSKDIIFTLVDDITHMEITKAMVQCSSLFFVCANESWKAVFKRFHFTELLVRHSVHLWNHLASGYAYIKECMSSISQQLKGDDELNLVEVLVKRYLSMYCIQILFFILIGWIFILLVARVILFFILHHKFLTMNQRFKSFVHFKKLGESDRKFFTTYWKALESLYFVYGYFKICILLFLDLIICPIILGWFLRICLFDLVYPSTLDVSLPLSSLANVLKISTIYPQASAIVHWIYGFLYILAFGYYLELFRQSAFRPGVLYFIRSAKDPHFDPMREYFLNPIFSHLGKLGLTMIIYITGLLGIILFNIKAFKILCPMFSQWLFSETNVNITMDEDSFSSILHHLTIDLYIIHMIPLVLKILPHPKALLATTIHKWSQFWAYALRLESFLLHDHSRDPKILFEMDTTIDSQENSGSKLVKYLNLQHHYIQNENSKILIDSKLYKGGKYEYSPNLNTQYLKEDLIKKKEDPNWIAFYSHFLAFYNKDKIFFIKKSEKDNSENELTLLGMDQVLHISDIQKSKWRNEALWSKWTVVFKPPWFKLRLFLYFIVSWLYTTLAIALLYLAPTALGRFFNLSVSNLLFDSNRFDETKFNFIVGFILISGTYKFILWVWSQRWQWPQFQLSEVNKYLRISVKMFVLLCTLFIIIPGFFILTSVKIYSFFTLNAHEYSLYFLKNPRLFIHAWVVWSINVILLHYVLIQFSRSYQDYWQRLTDHRGLHNIKLTVLFGDILVPVLGFLMGLNFGPPLIEALFTTFFPNDAERYEYWITLATFLFITVYYSCEVLKKLIYYLNESIKIEHYLLGEELVNFVRIESDEIPPTTDN